MNPTTVDGIHVALAILRDMSEAIWPLAPHVTTAMRFCAAAISLALASNKIARRKRKRPDSEE
jgi:hypothetical protein